MPAYNKLLDRFAGLDAQVVGISVDTVYSHMAWQKHEIGMMDYPLCSDFFPHGATAKAYGVFREGEPLPGINERAIFIVDKKGVIRFAKVYPIGQQPDNEETFHALEEIQKSSA